MYHVAIQVVWINCMDWNVALETVKYIADNGANKQQQTMCDLRKAVEQQDRFSNLNLLHKLKGCRPDPLLLQLYC